MKTPTTSGIASAIAFMQIPDEDLTTEEIEIKKELQEITGKLVKQVGGILFGVRGAREQFKEAKQNEQ